MFKGLPDAIPEIVEGSVGIFLQLAGEVHQAGAKQVNGFKCAGGERQGIAAVGVQLIQKHIQPFGQLRNRRTGRVLGPHRLQQVFHCPDRFIRSPQASIAREILHCG